MQPFSVLQRARPSAGAARGRPPRRKRLPGHVDPGGCCRWPCWSSSPAGTPSSTSDSGPAGRKLGSPLEPRLEHASRSPPARWNRWRRPAGRRGPPGAPHGAASAPGPPPPLRRRAPSGATGCRPRAAACRGRCTGRPRARDRRCPLNGAPAAEIECDDPRLTGACVARYSRSSFNRRQRRSAATSRPPRAGPAGEHERLAARCGAGVEGPPSLLPTAHERDELRGLVLDDEQALLRQRSCAADCRAAREVRQAQT